MTTEMETALYYTFSTIAQTLASALGLLAVFLALRINAFNRVIYDNMHELKRRRQSDTPEVPEALRACSKSFPVIALRYEKNISQ